MNPEAHQTPKEEQILPKELSAERAQGLVWKGFELSQGNNPGLLSIWEYVHRNYPNYKVSEDMQKMVLERLKAPVAKMLVGGPENPKIHSTASDTRGFFDKHDTSSILQAQIKNFADILNSDKRQSAMHYQMSDELVLKNIFQTQLASDSIYIVVRNGRPGDPNKKDIWDSNICKFVLASQPASTQYQEYDKMWQDIRSKLADFLDEHKDKMNSVVERYNTYHPDNQVENPIK